MASEIQGSAGNDIAGTARELARMPSVAQPPLAGNGAHPVLASATIGCAHEFAGERTEAGASRRPAVLAEQSEPASKATAPVTISPAIQDQHRGTTDLDLDLDLHLRLDAAMNVAAKRALAADA